MQKTTFHKSTDYQQVTQHHKIALKLTVNKTQTRHRHVLIILLVIRVYNAWTKTPIYIIR